MIIVAEKHHIDFIGGIMSHTSCYCYFAIKGDFDPASITKALGILPTKSWAIGDLRNNGSQFDFALWETGHTTIYLPANAIMDCSKAIEKLFGKEEIICSLKAEYDAYSVLEIVPTIENGRPPVIDLGASVIEFCSRTKTAIDIDMYVNPFLEIAELIPENKYDTSTIDDLMVVDEVKIQSILPQLLEWIADMNWPVAPEMLKVLARFPYSLVPHIRNALAKDADDDILKSWIILCLIPLFPTEVQQIFTLDIQRIVDAPSIGEQQEELDKYGKKLLLSF